MLIVQKYGGTSLMDTDRVRVAAQRAVDAVKAGDRIVVVVSAQGKTTDQMVNNAREITDSLSAREMDAYLASGEQMSASLMVMMLHSLGQKAVSLTGWQAGLLTDSVHGNARVKGLTNDRIRKELDEGNIVVVAGFQGINEAGDITTLGRGGSDTTAVALAALLGADLCRIYTDVDGVYDKDPRKFPDAVRFDRISYRDMLVLAQSGAQVLHDRSVELAMQYRVPVQVLSSFRPGPGTMVID
ncbi:MAG: aspartate kinase [Ruminococcaceae bacterium]|nr:aspartate kinase [Oscillospiraceae bacterium]